MLVSLRDKCFSQHSFLFGFEINVNSGQNEATSVVELKNKISVEIRVVLFHYLHKGDFIITSPIKLGFRDFF